jgi:4-oxalocrotonate tautomerase
MMPHIVIKCYKGRSDETKKAAAQRVREAIVQTMGCDEASVSVSVQDVEKSDWKSVYDSEILADEKNLIIPPGYTRASLD